MSDCCEPGEHRLHRHPPSLFWPLVFVGAGVILLLSNLGYVPWQSWNVLWRLWPLLLVALGVDLLIGLVVALVVFAQNIPALSELARAPELHTEHVEYPLDDVDRALISLDFSAAPCFVSALGDSPNLIEADVTLREDLIFETGVRGGQADVRLDSRWIGAWFWPFDLSDLQIDTLNLDSGSGAVELTLPSASIFRARVDSGSGSVSIVVPEGVEARVELDSGSGSFHPDERFHLVEGEGDGDGVWETENFDDAERTVVLEIDQGSGAIYIEQ